MKTLFLLEPGDLGFLPFPEAVEPVANAPAEFDFEKHFYHGLTRRIWNEYKLRHEVVNRLFESFSLE